MVKRKDSFPKIARKATNFPLQLNDQPTSTKVTNSFNKQKKTCSIEELDKKNYQLASHQETLNITFKFCT
ncbi:hypothetical protein B5X24_HaOG206767 [Helicoverpa armigera]|uniref:Uncharacterized protein n=1 Tax=Helicoverpa armigera TaxID=29058 RepID=A0A2W1BN69_HELAM|nr:hypothetical protein B5X24_HaOG206767 [Helicoverpa armigera]